MTATILRLPLADTRPRTRADCLDAPRPCPHAWCRHHLEHTEHSCVLDEVDARGDQSHHNIAPLLGVSAPSVYKLERAATRKLQKRLARWQGAEVARAIGALAAAQGVSYEESQPRKRQDGRPLQACAGWLRGWALDAGRVYATYRREVTHGRPCTAYGCGAPGGREGRCNVHKQKKAEATDGK